MREKSDEGEENRERDHRGVKNEIKLLYVKPHLNTTVFMIDTVTRYLSVSVVFRKAPPHHVGHAEGFDSQQVEDHRVGESELGLEEGRFALRAETRGCRQQKKCHAKNK